MDSLLAHFVFRLTPPVISLCQRVFSSPSLPPSLPSFLSYTFTCNFALPFFSLSQHFYLFPPSPLLAGRLGGDKFGGEQAEGRTNRVFVCPHSGTRDRPGWRRCSRALIGSGGGLEEASLPRKKKRLHFPLFF